MSTSLLVVLLGSLVNSAQKAWMGHVNLALVMSLLVSSTFGAQVGAGVSVRLAGARLRRYFVLVVLAGVGVVAYKVYSVLRGRVPTEAPALDLTTPERLLRVALCLAVPLLWAPFSYWLFGRFRRRRAQGPSLPGESSSAPPSAPGSE